MMNNEAEVLAELSRKFIDCSEALKGNASFKQNERGITFKGTPVFTFFGEKAVIMAQEPRERFKLADHITFDNILDIFREKRIAVTRVVRMSDFFNPEKQLDNMLSSSAKKNRELVNSLGLNISDDDLVAIEKLKCLKQKFRKIFSPYDCISDDKYKFTTHKSPELFTLGDKKITSINANWGVTVNKMKRTFEKVKPFWQGDVSSCPKRENYYRTTYNYEVISYTEDDITFGKNIIPRSEVERMALYYGWLT